eukprot:364585-Chlamydomonas_euryale.AAC.13
MTLVRFAKICNRAKLQRGGATASMAPAVLICCCDCLSPCGPGHSVLAYVMSAPPVAGRNCSFYATAACV